MNDPASNQNPSDAAGSDAERTVEIPAHEAAIARLKEERDHYEQQLQRALADTANMRRRQRQEMDDSRRRVLEGLTQELLPVLDSFQMALQTYDAQATAAAGATADPKALVDGVRLVRTLLTGALERHGLAEIQAQGLPFDPSRHEAVAVEPSHDVPEGHVVRVLQPGYLLGEHVVRHSKVTVAGPAAKA